MSKGPICVLGAGGIGVLQAYLLRRAGYETRLIGSRLERQVAFQPIGSPTPPTERFRIASLIEHIERYQLREQSLRHILVTTKQPQTIGALRPLLPYIAKRATVVFLQNGIDDRPRQLLTHDHCVVHGITTHAVAYDNATEELRWHANGTTTFQPKASLLSEARAWMSVLGQCAADEATFQNAQWRKCALNACINPVTALYNCRNGEVLHLQEASDMMRRLAQEVTLLMQAIGSFSSDWHSLCDDAFDLAAKTAQNTSSMLADRLAGRETEIEAINGFFLRLARQHNVVMPTHQHVFDLVSQQKWSR